MTRTTGTPTWLHLLTTDFESVSAFYTELFGWEFEDSGPQFGHYAMISKDGGLVGGAQPVPESEGANSAWSVFLAVDDLDARLTRATEHGASVVVPAGDAGPAGRFAILSDPTGAIVGMWEAGDTEGYAFTGQAGTPVWFEVLTQEFEASKAFYTDVFDFRPTAMQTPMDNDADSEASYVTNGPESEASSGICNVRGFVPESEGSWWRAYFAVDGCEQAIQAIERLGGKLLDGPEDSPFGRIATVADPAGASFQICSPSEAVAEGGA